MRFPLLLIVAGVPALAYAQADASRTAVAEIRARREASNAAIARHDTVGIAATLAPNFTIVTSNSVHETGRRGYVERFARQFRDRPDVTYRRTPDEVRVFEPWQMASERGRWTGSWTDPDGMIRLGGTYFAKWRRLGQAWFIESETFVPERCTGGAYCTAVPASVDPGLARLESELSRLSAIAAGKVGIGIIHLESGRELFLNGNEPFPMASTFKVPVAVELLNRVDAGTVRLDSMITLRPSDLHPGSGTLTNLFDDPGVSLSLRNLLELMLLISDNSATDLVLKAAGGGGAVNARLAALGVSGISVDRPTIQLIADAIGIPQLGPEPSWTRSRFDSLANAVTASQERAAAEVFYRDRRDTATPEGMARLLAKIWRGEAAGPASTALLLDIMLRCETGPMRLKGLLPPGTAVRHKTGSLGIGVANDVGIINLPDGAGHLVVAVFVKESARDVAAQERTIAQAARAAYDYFAFNPWVGGR